MKIYANTNNSTLEFLKQFMDTDVWVLCENFYGEQNYIHISEVNDTLICYDYIDDWELWGNHRSGYKPSYRSRVIQTKNFDKLWTFVCEPLSVLTIEEINDILNNLI